MSPARDQVRERGTWRFGALCASIALTVVTALPTSVSASPRLTFDVRPTAAVAKKPGPAKKKKKDRKKKDREPKTVAGMIKKEFGKHSDDALRVASCESKFDPNARLADAVGIFQIRTSLHAWRVAAVDGHDLLDAHTNVRVARHLFDEKGWQPWTCARIVGVSA